MSIRKRLLAITMSLTLLLPVNLSIVAAEEGDLPANDIVQLQPESSWNATVFGDVGGQDKIKSENFSVIEHADGSVDMESLNNTGKISSATEGIAYYYQAIDSSVEFELSATATVNSFDANNQVSFGIMLRDEIMDFQFVDKYREGDYLAVGALDQDMKVFKRQRGDEKQQKFKFDNPLEAPAAESTYQLKLKKAGSLYVLSVNDEQYTYTDYTGGSGYIGLFTARNTAVTYSDIELVIEEEETVEAGDGSFVVFGGNTSADKNPIPEINEQEAITLEATGGKVAGGDEGISYYYYTLPAASNFTIESTAEVIHFNADSKITTPNQKSFGLMLRDQITPHLTSTTATSNYVAVGALDTVMKGFYKHSVDAGTAGTGSQVKLEPFDVNLPTATEVYELKIEKSGDSYTLTVNGKSDVVQAADLFTDELYAGIYVARDAKVTFSKPEITIASKSVTSLDIDASAMKTSYYPGEQLTVDGLVVTAHYSDGSTEELESNDYVITGFDSSSDGIKQMLVHYKGMSEPIGYEVIRLSVDELTVLFKPAKTTYYIGDTLELQGLVVEGNYEGGYLISELTSDQYTIEIESTTLDGNGLDEDGAPYELLTGGEHIITIRSIETPETKTSFAIDVKEASPVSLEITTQPAKTVYYVGDELDLDGIVVYATYSDDNSVRLKRSELIASAFDSSTPGMKEITLTFRSLSTNLELEVKERSPIELEISSYPQTTYVLGESFNSAGLEVSVVYDNADRVLLDAANYTIDSSSFNKDAVGMYEIEITPTESELSSIIMTVTVREQAEQTWNSIIFGQSISKANNSVTVADDVITLEAKGGSAGKVTGDHDGISFYYVELDASEDNFELSANIKVIEYGKTPDYDGQESFGIMARDAIGEANNSSVFASNIAAVGGYSGGTRNPIGTQLFVRTGVTTPDGAGSQGIQAVMLEEGRPTIANTYPAEEYRLTLAKTNSGFTGSINGSEPELIYATDLMNVQDDKMYVGFYAARLATIEVHNIEFKVTAAHTDPPKVDPPAVAIEPNLELQSLLHTSSTDYTLLLQANVSGVLSVKQDDETIERDVAIAANEQYALDTELLLGTNRFTISFLPDETQYLTSYDTILLNRTVTVQQYEGDIYVSPTGTKAGEGTAESPLDLDTAIHYVAPGQTIVVQDGHYVRNAKLDILKYNDGTAEAMKTLRAAEDARPVIDFDNKTEGVILSGDYWHIIGLDFTRSAGNTKGFTIGGSHNIIELSQFYENGDTGLQISRTDNSNDMADWPSYNLILNSTSFANRDPSDNNADGFAAKLTSGVGNVFDGAIAYNNVDDGWDLYTKAGSGAIGAVEIKNSIAYNNGYPLGSTELKGDGNGFKLGGEGIHVSHVIRNSIAFNNGTVGFTSNSNPGVEAYNNIGFNNKKGNISFTTYGHIPTDFTIKDFVSYANTAISKDSVPAYAVSTTSYFYDGTASKNSRGVALKDSNFKSLVPPEKFERDSNGDIIWGDFLSFIAPSSGSGFNPPAAENGDSDDGNNEQDKSIVKVDTTFTNGRVEGAVTQAQLHAAMEASTPNERDKQQATIELAAVQAATSYQLQLPSAMLSQKEYEYDIVVQTPFGHVVLPSFMLKDSDLDSAAQLSLVVTNVEAGAGEINGNRPIVAFELYIDGQRLAYFNEDTFAELFIPYTPAAEELATTGQLTIWYLNEDGQPSAVPNAYYDEAAQGMKWRTHHFSSYAVAHVTKTFDDVTSGSWSSTAIQNLAAKGVILGVNETTFAPNAAVKRADFLLMLMRATGLTAKVEAEGIFNDVASDKYYANAINVAAKLGIVQGYPDGTFEPDQTVTRQEMFVMAYRAIEQLKAVSLSTDDSALQGFSDEADILAYARQIIATFVEAGVVKGSNDRIEPIGLATRAEVAVFIDRLLFTN